MQFSNVTYLTCKNFYVVYACMLSHFNHVQLFATLWTISCQALLSMGLSRQGYWSEFHTLLQGIFPTQGLNHRI